VILSQAVTALSQPILEIGILRPLKMAFFNGSGKIRTGFCGYDGQNIKGKKRHQKSKRKGF